MYQENNPNHSESRRQSDSFLWFNNTFPELRKLLYHVPNGEKRDPVTANRLKAMGVVPGVSDFVLHLWGRTYFIEFKDDKGKQSNDQILFQQVVTDHGFLYIVVRTFEEFKTFVNSLISVGACEAPIVEQFKFRNSVFEYIWDLDICDVQIFSTIATPEKEPLLRGYVTEFITDGYDKPSGFEILFTPDYAGFYKKPLNRIVNVIHKEKWYCEIPD